MKKLFSVTFGLVAAITMAMAFCLAGCASLFSFNGKFSQDEIVLTIGDEFAPSDYFNASKDVEFFVDDENIVSKSESGMFTALASGKTTLVAKSNGLLIDSAKVYVKYNFKTPTNLKMTNDGLLSWDSCALVLDGRNVSPTYKVWINGEEYDAPINQYQLTQAGTITVKIKTNSTTRVNASPYSKEYTFVFDTIDAATGLKFVSDDNFGAQTGTLSWSGEENAVLTIGNIQQYISGNEKVLDFSSYAEKADIEARLYITTNDGDSKTSIKTISKLYTQEASIKDNSVFWFVSNNVKYTLIRTVNVVTGETKIVKALSNVSVLEDLDEGIYTISNQAIAQEGYANGDVKNFTYDVGKVANVDAECSLSGTKLKIKFSTDSEYNKKFTVKQNDTEYVFVFTGEKVDGKYVLEHEFQLASGLNNFTVQASPTLGDGEFEWGGRSTKLAVKSDEKKIFSAYNLADITGLVHSTDEDENSILTFDNVEFANDFDVSINGIEVKGITREIGESKTRVNIGKITKEKYGNTQQFEIELTATRVPAENEIVSPSVVRKTVTMLAKTTLASCAGGQNVDNAETYSWTSDVNAKYSYELYATDETFDITGKRPYSETTTLPVSKSLTAGYYVIKVRSLPLDEDNYLASEEWAQDNFYFTEQIENPQVRLDYVEGLSSEFSGYVVKIKTVEFGYEYKVLFGGEETNLGSVFNSNARDELSFNLPASVSLNGENALKVVAIANGAAQQAIHSNSTSILNIEKLASPSQYSIIESDTKIEIANADSKAVLQLYKNGIKISESESGQNLVADISSFDGEFTLQARSVGYDEFDGYTTNGTTKIDSDFVDFVIHRSQTPFNLVYKNGTVSFEHSDKAQKYVATIVVNSANGSVERTFDAKVVFDESDNTKKSFDLENEIASLRSEDAEFNGAFVQRTQIVLSLYAYISEEIGGIYYIPSYNATAKHDSESRQITISKLDPVALEYDYDEKVIFWDGDESLNPVYDIYLGEEQEATIATKLASGKYEFDISAYDFSKAGEYRFYVIASSDNTLASDKSKNIVIRKISQVEKLDVIEKADGYYAKFAFAAGDEGHIDDVLINGESNGANSEFKLNSDTVSIVVKGENFVDANGDKIYYISSEPSSFTIAQLALNDFDANVEIANKTISWEDYASANASVWALTQPNASLKYLIEVYDGDTLKTTVSNISENKLALINENLYNLAKGNYSFKLYAYISEYEIANGGSGYYGKVLLQDNIALKKLAQVDNLSVEISDSETTIANELAKDVVLSWGFADSGSSSVQFEIYLNGELKTTVSEKTYTFSQLDFGKDKNTISVVAISATDIASYKTETSVNKYAQPQISIDDRGILTITDRDDTAVASGYIIEVTMSDKEGNSKTTEYYTTSREYDLNAENAGINERSGDIQIRVIQRVCHTSVNAIPSVAAEAHKTVLAAPTIAQTASGFIISSTDDGVTYFVKCAAKAYDEQVDGSTFTYPDTWESGEYKLIIYAQRKDAIDSWKHKEKTVSVNRVAAAASVKFTLDENYLDYALTWDAIENASEYEIETFKAGTKIGNTLKVDSPTVKLSAIRAAATDFVSGEYVLWIRSITDFASTAQTNSVPFKFDVSVADNTVANIELDDVGKLTFSSNNKDAFYIVTKQTDSTEEFGERVEATTKEYIVPKYTGKLEVSIVQVNNSLAEQTATAGSGVTINGAPVKANVNKLQDIVSVDKNSSTGKITINVTTEADEDKRLFIVSHAGVEKKLNVIKNGRAYEFLAIDMVNLFNDLTDGIFDFEIISYAEGYARSNAFECQIGYSNHNNASVAVKQDEANDYLLLKGETVLKGDSNLATAIHIIANEDYYYCRTPVYGYWVEDSNSGVENPKYFSAVEITGTGIESTRCCAVNISDLLADLKAGKINVKIGFVSMIPDTENNLLFTVVNYSENYDYKKLAEIEKLEIDEGNFKWSNTNEENTAFILYFDGTTQHQTAKISASDATYYLSENIEMTEEFSAGIKVVSSILGVLPSKITKYTVKGTETKVSQLSEIESEMTLTDGVLQLEFNTVTASRATSSNDKIEKKYPSIELMLQNRTSSADFGTFTDFAKQLITNRLTSPFSFRLEKLEDVKFNLMFKETGTNGVKKTYYTSVSAVNILTALNQDTLDEMYAAFNDPNITDADTKARINSVYKMLTNSDYFTGVASSSLLFKEIGQNEIGEYGFYSAATIPEGTYDIYIQQIGSAEDNTVSSQYKLAKAGANVVGSPLTRTDSEEITDKANVNYGKSVYYAKFVPIEGKLSYTMALRDKESGEIIEYKITYNSEDGKYYRSTFVENENKELALENGFVWIPLNGDNGVIYDDNITNIHGHELVVKEVKKKLSSGSYTQILNGSKFGGTDGEFTIGSTTFSYKIDESTKAVSIEGVTLVDGEFELSDGIVYSVERIDLSGHDFTVDIYADGDGVNINGKSETITVTFLEFNVDTLKLENGKFVWQNFVTGSTIYSSTVVTKQANTESTDDTEVKSSTGALASFTPTSAGSYDWFKFFTKGEANGFEIRVDSSVYMIENLYKLESPKISVVDGILNIKDNTASLDKRSSKNFILSNNVSEKKELASDQIYVIEDVTATANDGFLCEWETGLNRYEKQGKTDSLYDYHLTELTATRFDAAVSGDNFATGSFSVVEEGSGSSSSYYLVSVSERDKDNPILLQSEKANIDAAKLDYEGDDATIEIENGNLRWSKSIQSVAGDTLAEITSRKEGDLEIIYEVTIEFYTEKSASGDNGETYWGKYNKTSTIYTCSNELSADQIVDPVAGVEFKYIIYVQANVYAYTSNAKQADIVTIENISYNKVKNKSYLSKNQNGNGKYVLRGELIALGREDKDEKGNVVGDGLISRTPIVNDFKIASSGGHAGKLTWSVAAESYISGVTDFKIYAINNKVGTELVGKAELTDVIADKYEFAFTITSGQLDVDKAYNFEIVAYQKNKIEETESTPDEGGSDSDIDTQSVSTEEESKDELASNAVKLRSDESVKLLPNITASDYEVKIVSVEDGTENESKENRIYFDEYFSKYNSEYDNSINIRIGDIVITPSEGMPINLDENGMATYSAFAVPKDTNIYLRSDSAYEIKLNSIDWNKDVDNYYFDAESQSIYWTFGAKYEYKTNKDAEIYIKDEGGIHAFGVYEGEALDGNLILQIDYYDEEEKKIEGAYVHFAQVNIVDGKVKAKDGQSVTVFVNQGDDCGQLEEGEEYALSGDGFAVKATNPVTEEEKIYYLPTNIYAVGSEGNLVASRDCSYYTDAECTMIDAIASGTLIDGISSYTVGTEFTTVEKGNGKTYLLRTEDVLQYLSQTDPTMSNGQQSEEGEEQQSSLDDVTFQVSFTTTYSYTSNGSTISVTDTRTYKNVPIGAVTTDSFNGIAVNENGIRVTKFEFPIVGKITKVEIRARRNENNLASEALKADDMGSEIFNMNLFNRGEGTEENPYLIASAGQFENISYRLEKPTYLLNYLRYAVIKTTKGSSTSTNYIKNVTIKETDTTYHFKQTANFSVENSSGFVINQTFNGVYDGNEKQISVSVTGVKQLAEDEYVRTALPVSSGYDDGQAFNKGAGVFKTVGENGTVKNVSLKFALTVNSSMFESEAKAEEQISNKILIGGLVFKNLGQVDSITLTSSEVKFNSAIQSANVLAVAPIIGENRKNAINLTSTADVSITNDIKSGNQHFYYGGLVGFHNAGVIQFVKNTNDASATEGNISVKFSSNQNGTVAVGGVAIIARGTVDMALNTKNISASATGGNAFAGGVIALGVSAKLYSCVNTADVTASHAGGIAYAFYNSNVSTLVGLGTVKGSVQQLFAEVMSFGSSSSNERVYTYSTYKPAGNFVITTLNASKNISCKNQANYQIQVVLSSGVFSADIVKIK